MSSVPTFTEPFTRALATVSCIRFRQRTNVDLPHPEGPITAVAWRGGIVIEMSYKACVDPNHAFSPATSMPDVTLPAACERATTGDDADDTDGPDNERNEDKGPRPGQSVLFFEGRDCIGKYLQRQRRGGLIGVEVPKLIAECGEH